MDPRPMLAMWLAVGAVGTAAATDRYYPDQTVYSPDGKLRLEATSPDNAKGERGAPVPFARNFTYRLYDEVTGEVLWARRQGPKAGSPQRVFVGNHRWVVIWGAGEEIQVLAPAGGALRFTVALLTEFPEDERERHVRWTSAGPRWAPGSTWRFLELERKPHFVIRAWWGRRIILDLERRRVVPDEGRIRIALDRADREFVIETLRNAAALRAPRPDTCGIGVDPEVVSAALMAGHLGVHEAVPFLKTLETWEVRGGTVFGSGRRPRPDGAVDPSSFTYYRMRRTAQLSLRRLGEKPACFPATRFCFIRDGSTLGPTVPVQSPFTERANHVDKVRPGATAAEVLSAIGAPDFVRWREIWQIGTVSQLCWEYDIDGGVPSTLCIGWNEDDTVATVDTLRPPLWKEGNTRDEDVLW